MNLIKKIVALLIIIGNIFTLLHATGSPYANVKLKPIATNYDGQVLFQTFSDVNLFGSYSCTYDKFGWLVVSADGLWDERVAYDTSEIFDESSCEFIDKVKYKSYKDGKINLKNPDTVLKKMLDEYHFNRTVEESNEKFKVLELKPKQSCFGGSCIDTVLLQKSLDGLISTSLEPSKNAKSLRSSFYYEGVALFRTPFYVGEDTIYSKGDNAEGYDTVFNLPTLPRGRDYIPAFIDSIVFVKPFKFREPKSKVKKEIEEVVYDIVKLLKNADVKSFEIINKKYIHPKYGFYFIQRPGLMDHFYHYKKFNIDDVINKRRPYTAVDFIIGTKPYNIPKVEWETTRYRCENDTWSVKGLIVNDLGYNILEGISYQFEHSTKEEKVRAKFLAKDVWNVTVTAWSVVFEVKKIDGHWYIVLVNSSEMDCSA